MFVQCTNKKKLLGASAVNAGQFNLTEFFNERGTEIDALCVVVCQCSIQLILAANKNIKTNYVVISAKAIHYANEIVRLIDDMENVISQAKTGIAKSFQGVVFPNSEVRLRIKEKSKQLSMEVTKQLMLTTRIAVGVW